MSSALDENLIRAGVGGNVRRYREALGISQSELARRVDTVPRNISRIEAGVGLPSIPLLYRIAKELAVHPGVLLLLDGTDDAARLIEGTARHLRG